MVGEGCSDNRSKGAARLHSAGYLKVARDCLRLVDESERVVSEVDFKGCVVRPKQVTRLCG